MITILLLFFACFVNANSPFPSSLQPTKYLYSISEAYRTPIELLALDSLSGYLARNEPKLYRVSTYQWRNNSQDSYGIWLSNMEKNGVTVDDSLINSSLSSIVQHFITKPAFYILCNATNESVSVAVTLAASSESLILIAGDSATAAQLEKANVTLIQDVRDKLVDKTITENVLSEMSKHVFVFQDPSKSQFLVDWALFARAPYMKWNSTSIVQNLALNRVVDHGAAFGWGPENDYVTQLNMHGIWVHASDYNKNFAALSNVKMLTKTDENNSNGTDGQGNHSIIPKNTYINKHTVSFMLTDGDNLQWTLGPWSTSQQWYGSPQRGAFPMGWTVSPAIVDLAPAAMRHILETKTKNDELISGPSGYGYVYPTTLPLSNITEFAKLTFNAMNSFQMNTMNVLGQNDEGTYPCFRYDLYMV
jgi:hypothetical protein